MKTQPFNLFVAILPTLRVVEEDEEANKIYENKLNNGYKIRILDFSPEYELDNNY